ncbi:PIN domain-like protein [Blastocladiella britannica]|nr:PIN domain-like protein [Blastocladiella britannica]
MGIKEFAPLVRQHAPQLYRTLSGPSALRGMRLAIDGHMLLYRFWHAGLSKQNGDNDLALERQTRARSAHNHHVQLFYNLLEYCEHEKITPLLVFDGVGSRPLQKELNVRIDRELAREQQRQLLAKVHQVHQYFSAVSTTESTSTSTLAASESYTTTTVITEEIPVEPAPSVTTESELGQQPLVEIPLQAEGGTTELDLDPALLEAMLLTDKPDTLIDGSIKPTLTLPPRAVSSQTNLAKILQDESILGKTRISRPAAASVLSALSSERARLTHLTMGLPGSALDDVLALARSRSVPCILTPPGTEAEQVCGALVHFGHADAVASGDSDAAVFYMDVPVVRDFFKHGTVPSVMGPLNGVPPLDVNQGEELRASTWPDLYPSPGTPSLAASLGLKRDAPESILDLAVLLGCDFSAKIPRVGKVSAVKLLAAHHSLAEALAANPQLAARAQADPRWAPDAARAVFEGRGANLTAESVAAMVSQAQEQAASGGGTAGGESEVAVLERYGIEPYTVAAEGS